jgi:hypothetical protein
MNVFRQSMGDVKIIKYGKWGDPNFISTNDMQYQNTYSFYSAQIILWSVWFLNVFFI